MKCGFSPKATYQQILKKLTGSAPAQFGKSLPTRVNNVSNLDLRYSILPHSIFQTEVCNKSLI